MFMRKKKKAAVPEIAFDREKQRAVVRCSICTGEQVAGLKDIHTGKFTEVMVIRGEEDIRRFMELYGLETIEKEY